MATVDVDTVRERMSELSAAREHFGRMRFEQTADAAIAGFEAMHGIALPEEHRLLLAAFGDRPPLPRIVGGRAVALAEAMDTPVYASFRGDLAVPFRYGGPEPASLAWDDEADDYVDPCPLDGALCLGSGGCDVVWILIVTGADRGKVFSFVPGLEREFQPTGMGLLEFCLDGVEAKLREAGHHALTRARDPE